MDSRHKTDKTSQSSDKRRTEHARSHKWLEAVRENSSGAPALTLQRGRHEEHQAMSVLVLKHKNTNSRDWTKKVPTHMEAVRDMQWTYSFTDGAHAILKCRRLENKGATLISVLSLNTEYPDGGG